MDGLAKGAGEKLSETYPALPASVPRARRAVVRLAAAAGASDDEVDAVRLATSEALTNAVVHAYGGAPGLIHVCAVVAPDGLSVTVADDGSGVEPRVDRRGMGIGLALIAEAAVELAICRRPTGGTALKMKFAVSPRT